MQELLCISMYENIEDCYENTSIVFYNVHVKMYCFIILLKQRFFAYYLNELSH